MNITPEFIDRLLRQLGVVAARAGAIRLPGGGIEAAFTLPYMVETARFTEIELVRWDAHQLVDAVHGRVERLRGQMLAHLRDHMDVRDSDIELVSAQADKLVSAVNQHLGKLSVPYDAAAAITLEIVAFRDLITRVREGRNRIDVRQPDEDAEPKAEPAVSETRTMMTPG